MAERRVISIGSINCDMQIKVRRWPGPGETVAGEDFLMTGGGKGANVAFQASMLGVSTCLVARTGNDFLGQYVVEHLRDAGINLCFVKKTEGVGTGISSIAVLPGGDKRIIFSPNANYTWKESDLEEIRAVIDSSSKDSVLVIDCEISQFVVKFAIKHAYKTGIRVILDPSPADLVQEDVLGMVEIITPNKTEAKLLTGIEENSIEDAFRAARVLREKGVGMALMKMGEQGCVVSGRNIEMQIPTIKTELVDQTGAGDAFAGAVAAGLVKGMDIESTVRMANIVSALAIKTYGSQKSYVDMNTVRRYL